MYSLAGEFQNKGTSSNNKHFGNCLLLPALMLQLAQLLWSSDLLSFGYEGNASALMQYGNSLHLLPGYFEQTARRQPIRPIKLGKFVFVSWNSSCH
ncbi:hypothetical protein WR25_00892 [Diploscapter pachys]|uniref:Uncharacterized protein n=1 Tax=Diploscapter pachys TaxID=2018661 RepID=A0A2A2KVV7_9BILA|nr:hypothetical protein WR25_00892 [Diploscapter pachys]